MGADPAKAFNPRASAKRGPIVADLGQHPGTGQIPQPGEADDDRGVRVLFKMVDRRLGEFVGSRAGGLELAQQRAQLDTHRVFHHCRLVQVGVGEDRVQPLGVAVEVTAAAGLDQQPAQPRRGQLGSLGGGGCGGQDSARIGAGQPPGRQLGEGHQGGRIEVFEQVADLVADLLAAPHRVLLGAGQHLDGLGQVGVGWQRAVRVTIGAHDIGQQHRVGGIRFSPDSAYRARYREAASGLIG